MQLSKHLDIFIIIILAFAFISRGYLGIINDLVTWLFAFYYFVMDRQKLKTINKSIFISSFLLAIYLTFNLLFRDSTSYQVFYYFSILIPYYFIFRSSSRAYMFSLISGIMCALVSFFIILHLAGIMKNYELFYSRSGLIRASGLMYNPNYFAYMNFIIFILLYLSPIKKPIKLSLLFFIFLAVVFSFSRGVTAGLIIFLVLNIFRREWIKYIFILPVIIIPLVIISNNFFIAIFDLEAVRNTIEYRLSNLKSGDLSGRSSIWIFGFQAWFNDISHILFGFGFGNFQKYVGVFDIENTVHNSFLRSLYELGLIGVILLTCFYYSLVNNIRAVNNKTKIIIISSVLITWFSNDFFINKDTFLLLIIMILSSHIKLKSLQPKIAKTTS